MKADPVGKYKWEDILSALCTRGAKCIMIEGGGVVINDILTQRMADVIVFISPVFLGRNGVAVHPILGEPGWLEDVQSITLGNDVVVIGRMKRDKTSLDGIDNRGQCN